MKNKIAVKMHLIISLVLIVFLITAFVPAVYAEEKKTYYNDLQLPSARSGNDETFAYTRKEIVEDVNLGMATPHYYNQSGSLSNSCAATAGSVIVGYYDRVYENLIPNYVPVIKRGPLEVFKPMNFTVQSVISSLFYGMNTNKTEPGATEDDFKNGLRDYVNSKNYSIAYQTKINGSSVDWNAVKSSLQGNTPLAIFMTPHYLITSLVIGETSATLKTMQYTANHIMIVNGMKVVNYYDNANVKRTDRYLKVSSGLKEAMNSYLLMNSTAKVNDIVGVSIS